MDVTTTHVSHVCVTRPCAYCAVRGHEPIPRQARLVGPRFRRQPDFVIVRCDRSRFPPHLIDLMKKLQRLGQEDLALVRQIVESLTTPLEVSGLAAIAVALG
jgi:hypothetical protein